MSCVTALIPTSGNRLHPSKPVIRRSRSGLGTRMRCPRVSFHAAAAVAILLLTACSPPPPIVSADTSCERFAHIHLSDAQIAAIEKDYDTWESGVDQIVQHNVEYDKSCLGPVKP